MPPQIKRLLPLFIIFIGLFLIARHFLIPESFGKYGHYRALALDENAARPMHFAGRAACAECHEDVADAKSEDVHAGLSCEVCHGPGQAHVNAPGETAMFKPSGRDFCGRCHTLNPARNSNVITQIDLKEHNPGIDCIECHNPHKPWDLKEQGIAGENF